MDQHAVDTDRTPHALGQRHRGARRGVAVVSWRSPALARAHVLSHFQARLEAVTTRSFTPGSRKASDRRSLLPRDSRTERSSVSDRSRGRTRTWSTIAQRLGKLLMRLRKPRELVKVDLVGRRHPVDPGGGVAVEDDDTPDRYPAGQLQQTGVEHDEVDSRRQHEVVRRWRVRLSPGSIVGVGVRARGRIKRVEIAPVEGRPPAHSDDGFRLISEIVCNAPTGRSDGAASAGARRCWKCARIFRLARRHRLTASLVATVRTHASGSSYAPVTRQRCQARAYASCTQACASVSSPVSGTAPPRSSDCPESHAPGGRSVALLV